MPPEILIATHVHGFLFVGYVLLCCVQCRRLIVEWLALGCGHGRLGPILVRVTAMA